MRTRFTFVFKAYITLNEDISATRCCRTESSSVLGLIRYSEQTVFSLTISLRYRNTNPNVSCRISPTYFSMLPPTYNIHLTHKVLEPLSWTDFAQVAGSLHHSLYHFFSWCSLDNILLGWPLPPAASSRAVGIPSWYWSYQSCRKVSHQSSS